MFFTRFLTPSITFSIAKHFESIFKHSGGETFLQLGSGRLRVGIWLSDTLHYP